MGIPLSNTVTLREFSSLGNGTADFFVLDKPERGVKTTG
jgi:hypothetical protein